MSKALVALLFGLAIGYGLGGGYDSKHYEIKWYDKNWTVKDSLIVGPTWLGMFNRNGQIYSISYWEPARAHK